VQKGATGYLQESSCLIKGNINSKGVKTYHSPGQREYEAKPKKIFVQLRKQNPRIIGSTTTYLKQFY